MKKIIFSFLILLLCTSCTPNQSVMGRKTTIETAQIYCVDSDLYKLIPYNVDIESKNTQQAAQKVLDNLIYGMKYEKINHIIPCIDNGVTVKVEGDTAFVNFSQEMVKNHPDDMDSEYLTVYSIVNSLASLDGVTAIKFTIDGEEQKDFKGFLDMRETFLPDYMV